jgi:hypothetical protein
MSQDRKNEILARVDKADFDTRDPLATIFRRILAELGIGILAWSQLMNRYLADPTNGIDQSPKKRSTERGNLDRRLFARSMSWKAFRKALKMFSYITRSIHIEFAIEDLRGRKFKVGLYLYKKPDVKEGP